MTTERIGPIAIAEHEVSLDTPSCGEIVIRPSKGIVPLNLRGLRSYRGLLYFLCWRDIKVRYKQTLLGAAWAILQPVFWWG